MLKPEIVEHIRQNHKFPKTLWRYYIHYSFYLFSAVPFSIGAYLLCNFITSPVGDIISIVLISIGVFLGYLIYCGIDNIIYFKSISSIKKIDIDKLAEKMQEYFKVMNIVVDKKLGVIRIHSSGKWTFSPLNIPEGSLIITVIIDGFTILINTQIDYDRNFGRNPFTWFAHKDNYNLLKWIIDYQLK